VLLGVVRIIVDDLWDNGQFKADLHWFADDDQSALTKRCKDQQTRAGDVADNVAGSLGRAAATAAESLVSPFVKLPDDLTKAISFISRANGRKALEVAMHRQLAADPAA
jgi:hypothetical protein